jgi:hypothetical protein
MTPLSSVVNSFKLYFSNSNRWTILVAIISGIAYYLAFDFLRWNQYDSASYEAGARLLFGLEGGADLQGRMSKPLVLLLPGFFEYVFGITPKYGFLTQSGICFVLLLFLWKEILRNLNFSENIQKLGVLMLVLSQPVAVFSFGILADFPGWCFMLWLINTYLTSKKSTQWMKIALITFIGLLVKESVFVGVIFILISEIFKTPNRIINVLKFVMLFSVIYISTQLLLQSLNFDGLLSRQREIRNWGGVFEIQDISQVFQVWRAFEGVWWFLLVPVFFQNKERISQHWFRVTIVSFVVCVVIIPFIHPAFLVDRVLFMFFPLIFIPVLMLVKTYEYPKLSVLIVISGIFSLSYTWLIYHYTFQGIFPVYFTVSLIFPLTFLYLFHRKGSVSV